MAISVKNNPENASNVTQLALNVKAVLSSCALLAISEATCLGSLMT